jgi:hypothetical protein
MAIWIKAVSKFSHLEKNLFYVGPNFFFQRLPPHLLLLPWHLGPVFPASQSWSPSLSLSLSLSLSVSLSLSFSFSLSSSSSSPLLRLLRNDRRRRATQMCLHPLDGRSLHSFFSIVVVSFSRARKLAWHVIRKCGDDGRVKSMEEGGKDEEEEDEERGREGGRSRLFLLLLLRSARMINLISDRASTSLLLFLLPSRINFN